MTHHSTVALPGNPDMSQYVVFCVGRGLCDGLITRSEESYRVSVYV
jgi:hypothetical protein